MSLPILFHIGSALGILPFGGFSSRKDCWNSSLQQNPRTVGWALFSIRDSLRIGPPILSFWVRALRNRPNIARHFTPGIQAPPMGFDPLQGLSVRTFAGFRRTSSRVLHSSTDCSAEKPAPQSINQLSPSILPPRVLTARQPSWGFRTCSIP